MDFEFKNELYKKEQEILASKIKESEDVKKEFQVYLSQSLENQKKEMEVSMKQELASQVGYYIEFFLFVLLSSIIC